MTDRERHEDAVRAALKMDVALQRLFAKMGTEENPNGLVVRAYRLARRGLADAKNVRQVRDGLMDLRRALAAIVNGLIVQATEVGSLGGMEQADAWGLPMEPGEYSGENEAAAWMATIDGQMAASMGVYASSDDILLVVGDGERMGSLTPGPVTRDGSRWIALAAGGALAAAVAAGAAKGQRRREIWRRQAVAAIDERTTECCLRVHGQVVGMEERFRLTGTPRFADEVMAPPFHWWCRSSVALVPVSLADDGLSVEMREAAATELAERETTGMREVIHPASATSRR